MLSTGGSADAAAQDSFCASATCVITVVYDQSGRSNDLWYQGSSVVPGSSQSSPAIATTESLAVGGNKVYSLYINPGNSYWRDGHLTGVPVGAEPEGMYMVTSATHVNSGCCFNYGNSVTTRAADAAGAMVSGYPSDATEDAVQANVISAGYAPSPGGQQGQQIEGAQSGHCVEVPGGNSTADGAKAVQQSGTPTWTISTTQDAYTLRYNASGKVLDVNAGSSTVGLQLQQWSANGGTNQMWYLRPTGDGYYTIVARNSGLLADVYGAATSDGAQVVQWTANGGTNQQWQFVPT